MRKIISFTHATLDGYIDEPHKWSFRYSGEQFQVRTQDDAVRRRPCRGRPARRIPDLHPPIVKGGGEPLFRPASAATLELLDQQRFATGAVIHAYQLSESGAGS